MNRRKNGDTYWERMIVTPIHNASGEIMNFLAVKEDITTEIEAQQQILESDKLAAVGVLAAGVAHEFKNYLGGIVGNASFALEELEDDNNLEIAKETLSRIVEMGERANQVAMSLLSYSKAQPTEMALVNLQEIVEQTISLLEKELKTRTIEIATFFEEIPLVEVIAGKIQQLLLNLLINAEQAISSHGAITVALVISHELDHVLLKVGDTGPGISKDILSKIFDPFFSTKGVWGKDDVSGTGLGLSICRNIAHEHNGDLTAISNEGLGTTFILKLPLVKKSTNEDTTTQVPIHSVHIFIFSLDTSIMSNYFKAASSVDVELYAIDDIDRMQSEIFHLCNLVILDAKFAGKVELLRMVERCTETDVPHIVVNCGTKEYQLAYLYEKAAAVFHDTPEFGSILSFVGKSSDKQVEAEYNSSIPQ